ncbi:Uncharacterised protein [Streptococcus pneumoniae]|nr:Uncharacterised protein [Streptococcus pneumoniae]CEY96025.1 Uncharacterised protein [Streptococcus pneumoniae]CGE83593.1 Uncharacterised protein [Streptococcus pneumoniae]CIU10851.1 Uncharacterised protein [Streptococcus pneumoniae]CJP49046.1 Uncharacterised protein [Streptococcus pneumoniae]
MDLLEKECLKCDKNFQQGVFGITIIYQIRCLHKGGKYT